MTEEIIYVNEKSVSCDGGKGILGHPKIYLHMGAKDNITCPYCSRKFVIAGKEKKGD